LTSYKWLRYAACMAAAKKKKVVKLGRPAPLTEQIVFRVSKASIKRLRAYQAQHELETRADALRAALRSVGI
jgi:hypothetical protein